MAGKTLNFYNLTGGLNTVQDLYTINSNPNRTETPEMYNIEYYKLGGLQSMRGNIPYGQTLDSGITCGFEYILGNEIYNVVTTQAGSIYIYNKDLEENQFEKVGISFTNTSPRHSICHFNNGFIVSDGSEFIFYKKNTLKEPTTVKAIEESTKAEVICTVRGVVDTNKISTTTGLSSHFLADLKPGNIIIIKNREGVAVTEELTVTEVVSDSEFLVNKNLTNSPVDRDLYLLNNKIEDKFIPVFKDTQDSSVKETEIKGLAINSYQGRLWVGASDGNLYYSAVGFYNDFDLKFDAGYYGSFFEDNSDFTALGIWSEYLVAHKRQGTYLIDGTNSNSAEWVIKPYSESTCESQQSFISNDVGYYIYSKVNQAIVPLLTRSLYNTTYQGKELSVKIRNVFTLLDSTKYNEIYVTYHPLKQYLMFYMNFKDGNGYSNKCYIFDLQTKSWLLRLLPQKVTAAYQVNNEVYVGTEDGKVLKEFYGSTFNGEPINFSWLSPSYVWGGGTNYTTTSEFRTKMLNIASNHFYIETIRDGWRKSKSRLITNNIDNGTTLFWDIGINKEDEVTGLKIGATVYEYTGNDNKTYYSTTDLRTGVSFNIPMYYDKELKQLAGYNNTMYIIKDSTKLDYNHIDYVETPIYAWREKDLSYKCYKNGNLLAWVQDSKTTALVNIKTTKTKRQKIWAFYGTIGAGRETSDIDRVWGVDNKNVASLIEAAKLNYNYPAYLYSVPDKRFYRRGYDGWTGKRILGWVWICMDSFTIGYPVWSCSICIHQPYDQPQSDEPGGLTQAIAISRAHSAQNAMYARRRPEFDEYEDITQEVWNGRNDSKGALNKSFTKSGDSIVININGSNQTFTRYSDGDYGDYLSESVFTLSKTPKVGDNIYKANQEIYSTIKSVTSNSITSQNNKVLYRTVADDDNIITPKYQKREQMTFTYVTEYDEAIDYPYITDRYNLSLTDTIWANGRDANGDYTEIETTKGNLWVKEGYTNKRCILSNQYFTTIQYRLYGTVKEDSMAISGFEIDGIQLTEVPH